MSKFAEEEELCAFWSEVPVGGISEAALSAAAKDILWTVATGIAGAGALGSEVIRAFAVSSGTPPQSTVWGFGDRCAMDHAGFANGSFAKALEYEDKFWMDYGHGFAVGPTVVPAAVATVEDLGSVSGVELLGAVALAIDFNCRLLLTSPDILQSPWNGTYLYPHLSATVAVGRLSGLSKAQLLNALGIAYSQVAGNWQSQVDPSLGVRMQAGFAARNAIQAVRLAQLGATGTHGFLSGVWGLHRTFFREGEYDTAPLREGLGEQFLGTRMGVKAYPCGLVAHSALNALEVLIEEHGLGDVDVEQVESVIIEGTPRMRIMLEPDDERRQPTSHSAAEFSLPWVVASLLRHGELKLDYASPSELEDEKIRDLALNVSVSMERDPADGVRAQLAFRDGSRLSSSVIVIPKGHPDNPIEGADLEQRVRASLAFGPTPWDGARAKEFHDGIMGLRQADDCKALIDHLA